MAAKKATHKRPHWTEAPEGMQARIRSLLHHHGTMRRAVTLAQSSGYRIELNDVPSTYTDQFEAMRGMPHAHTFEVQHRYQMREERQARAMLEAMQAAGLFDKTIEELANEKRTAAELEQAKRDAFIAERTTAAYERLAQQERARIERLAAAEYDAANGRAGR